MNFIRIINFLLREYVVNGNKKINMCYFLGFEFGFILVCYLVNC